ncbi:MAG TPA: hypothetical protein ENJ75_03120 [Candidatus Kaiserbacteria bacterium]|nr:hypothetical protein [Candidatus Kaiserbacteria bacterium]
MKKDRLITISVAVALGIVLLGAGYFYFSGSSVSELPVTSANTASSTKRFKGLAEQLSPLSFDTGIFSDARFKSLHTITAQFTAVPAGRTDPFAPF